VASDLTERAGSNPRGWRLPLRGLAPPRLTCCGAAQGDSGAGGASGAGLGAGPGFPVSALLPKALCCNRATASVSLFRVAEAESVRDLSRICVFAAYRENIGWGNWLWW